MPGPPRAEKTKEMSNSDRERVVLTLIESTGLFDGRIQILLRHFKILEQNGRIGDVEFLRRNHHLEHGFVGDIYLTVAVVDIAPRRDDRLGFDHITIGFSGILVAQHLNREQASPKA